MQHISHFYQEFMDEVGRINFCKEIYKIEKDGILPRFDIEVILEISAQNLNKLAAVMSNPELLVKRETGNIRTFTRSGIQTTGITIDRLDDLYKQMLIYMMYMFVIDYLNGGDMYTRQPDTTLNNRELIDSHVEDIYMYIKDRVEVETSPDLQELFTTIETYIKRNPRKVDDENSHKEGLVKPNLKLSTTKKLNIKGWWD